MKAACIHIVERSEKLCAAFHTRCDMPLQGVRSLLSVSTPRLCSCARVRTDADGSPSSGCENELPVSLCVECKVRVNGTSGKDSSWGCGQLRSTLRQYDGSQFNVYAPCVHRRSQRTCCYGESGVFDAAYNRSDDAEWICNTYHKCGDDNTVKRGERGGECDGGVLSDGESCACDPRF